MDVTDLNSIRTCNIDIAIDIDLDSIWATGVYIAKNAPIVERKRFWIDIVCISEMDHAN